MRKFFERVDAAAFALFDVPSGSQVGWAPDRAGLFELLEEILEQAPSAPDRLLVVAVDDKGQRMGSWRASSLLDLARRDEADHGNVPPAS